jgi:hypothetical protein
MKHRIAILTGLERLARRLACQRAALLLSNGPAASSASLSQSEESQ